jgi:hypothetical protein
MVLDDITYSVTLNKAKYLEERLLILLKPCPRYIPYKLWIKLAAKFIVIQEQYTNAS